MVPGVRAQTAAELQAQVNALLAQIAALQAQLGTGGSTAAVCPYVWQRSLGQGSTGFDVLRLQQFLNASADTRLAVSGAGSPGMETQYYGPITANAVSRFQVKYRADILTPLGLVNPTGYFGPSSRAKINALCLTGPVTPPDDDDDDTGELEGGAGSLDEAEFVSNLSGEEVGEGQEDQEVAGLEITPEGSDIEITAVELTFVHQNNVANSSDDFDDYADEVSLWLDGEEVGRIDGEEFDDDDDFSQNITLEDTTIIREGDMEELVVAISALNNLDSADEGEEWTVEFESIRFRDADGAVITDSSTGDVGETREFSFESFTGATGAEFSISEGDDEINDGRVINVDDADETDDVELLSVMAEAEGDSDMSIDEAIFSFDLTGTATDLNDMISSVHLVIDGDEVATENASAGTSVTFDDLDISIDAGDEVEIILTADFHELDNGTYDEGDTIAAETDADDWEIEDEQDDELDDADKTGTASSDAHSIFDTGFEVDLVSVSETKTRSSDTVGVGDQGQYTIRYEVTAVDGDIYIDDSCTEDNDGSEVASAGNSYSVTNPTDNSTQCSFTSSADEVSNSFRIEEGETETFTLTVVVTAVNDNFAQVSLEAIGWATAAGNGTNVYDSNLGDFETDPLFLNMP